MKAEEIASRWESIRERMGALPAMEKASLGFFLLGYFESRAEQHPREAETFLKAFETACGSLESWAEPLDALKTGRAC